MNYKKCDLCGSTLDFKGRCTNKNCWRGKLSDYTYDKRIKHTKRGERVNGRKNKRTVT